MSSISIPDRSCPAQGQSGLCRAEVRQKEYEERQAARKAQFAETAGDPYWKEVRRRSLSHLAWQQPSCVSEDPAPMHPDLAHILVFPKLRSR